VAVKTGILSLGRMETVAGGESTPRVSEDPSNLLADAAYKTPWRKSWSEKTVDSGPEEFKKRGSTLLRDKLLPLGEKFKRAPRGKTRPKGEGFRDPVSRQLERVPTNGT